MGIISIYITIPQLLGSSYSPNPEDLVFPEGFLSENTLKLFNFSINLQPFPIELGKKYDKSCMGGTFDHLHPGHLIFLTYAAAHSSLLGIGITHPSILSHKSNFSTIQPWEIRSENVKAFLNTIKPSLVLDIFELFDPVSKAGYGDFEAVILTTEVEKAFELINAERAKNSLNPLEKLVVNLIELSDSKISSTSIRSEIQAKNKNSFEEVKRRWEALCQNTSIPKPTSEKWWDIISSQYSRTPRYYHTLSHLDSCYKHLENSSHVLQFTLFFHDLVYIPMKHPMLLTNEEISAVFFQKFLEEAGLSQEYLIVKDYILATISHSPRTNTPEELEFLDTDLSILAVPWENYLEYASSIRSEYSWLTQQEFNAGRKAVMQRFLSRPKIYFTKNFEEAENAARSNIEKEINEILS